MERDILVSRGDDGMRGYSLFPED